MPSKRNIELLAKTKEKVERSSAMFFVDFQGLTHKQLEEARSLLKEVESELSVIKNTLMSIALKEKGVDLSSRLQGPLAVLFSYGDSAKAAKILHVFFKKYNLLASKIKFGLFEGNVIEEETVVKLANLPPREILLAKLVGILKSPMTGFVYSLNWNVQKLVMTLKEIEHKKS